MMRGQDLVLGLARRYKAAQLAPFVLSLRETGYRGRIVFLVAELDDATESFLRAHGVELVPFDVDGFPPYHYQNSRFFIYLEYLLDSLLRGAVPRSVLMSDVRDVIFQGDPFAFDRGRLDVFYENEAIAIGECKFNAHFFHKTFGDDILGELAECRISCSGTTIGTAQGTIEYLIEMWNVMMLLSDRAAGGLADQAAHNLIVHRGLVDGTRVHANGDHVLTLHHIGSEKVSLRADGRIIGENGVVCPIVHQYDRHPALRDAIAARYAASTRVAAGALT